MSDNGIRGQYVRRTSVRRTKPRATRLSKTEETPVKKRLTEQQIIGIRNGYVGTAPVLWPNFPAGTYTTGQDPYTLARIKLN